jgi:hypothetical protein
MARPSKYKPEFAEQATKLCKLGATDREMAEFFQVSESTFNLWKTQYPELSESLKLAKEAADKRVEQSLYRRALGYSHDSMHVSNFQGQVTLTPIVEHYPPDTTACIFWLKNRRPDEWRDVKGVEHSGTMTHRDARELTEADLDALILERARSGEARKARGKKEPSGVH